jgi:hypothetical protein
MNKIIDRVFPMVFPFCLFIICYAIPDNKKQRFSLPESKSVEVELSIPHEEQGLSLFTNCMDNNVNVIFKNKTDSVVRIYQDWNLWGWFNVTFEIETPDSIYKTYRKDRDWPKNFPAYYCIDPGESLVCNYNLKSLVCYEGRRSFGKTVDSEWLGLPEKKYDSAKIRIVYQLAFEVKLFIDSTDSRYESIKRSFPTELSSKQYNIHIR